MLSSLDEHQLLVFWVQLASLVVVARLLGSLMRRFGQPSVVGELAAGLVLGPSVFGQVWPSGFHWFLPNDDMQGAALVSISWIGVALLLVVTGFETDLGLIRRFGRAAALVATGSLVIPFLAGLAVGWALPVRFAGTHQTRLVFALFIATALSISSLPVIAKILSELNLMRRNFGQINLAAGMANDSVGWLILGIISGLAASGHISLGRIGLIFGGMAGFLLVSFTVGQRLVDRGLRKVRSADEGGAGEALTVVIFAMLLIGVAAQALGIEAVLGAFVAGILLGRSRFAHEDLMERVEGLTMAFVAPVFFATAGLRVDLSLLAEPEVLVWSVVILVVASIAKFAGSFFGARLAGLDRREGLALGAGLNARGAMEVVIATVGLGLGVLNDAAYTAIVLMAMVTSMAAPPTLRLAVRNWRGSEEEQERLEREEALERNLVVKGRRLLLPTRGLPNSIAAAQILHFAWPEETPITVLTVGRENGEPVKAQPVMNVVEERPHEEKPATGTDAVSAVLAEAKLGYGVIGLGVADTPTRGTLLSAMADGLLLRSTLPMVVVRRARNLETRLPGIFSRALVPVSGTQSSRAAQEIAFNIASHLGTEIILAHVVNRAVAERAARPPSSGNGAPAVDPVAPDLVDDFQDEELVAAASIAPASTPAGGLARRVLQRVGSLRGRPQPTAEGSLPPAPAGAAPNAAAARVVEQAEDLAREVGVPVSSLVRIGASTASEILATARERECDLIILGASPRKLDDRAFLGHMVEEVLDSADATVVVVTVPSER
jgi:Kef-type K+ transport system membrane component KefB/nucleotide-binding universal stress UspA family protein